MGKKQHSKDKMYLTSSEVFLIRYLLIIYQLAAHKTANRPSSFINTSRSLPFNYCSISFQPIKVPCCDNEGNMYEYNNIVEYLNEMGKSPVTKLPMSISNITKLHIHNYNGKLACPITNTIFTETTKICAILTSGNVYSYEAIEQLNLKTKSFNDLLTTAPFTKDDIIILHDPQKQHIISSFANTKSIPKSNATNDTTDNKQKVSIDRGAQYTPKTYFSDGQCAKSATSTISRIVTSNKILAASRYQKNLALYEKLIKLGKKTDCKAYVTIVTSLGNLNLQLHADITPLTVHNFILLCERKYYNGTIFHRLIRDFMIQGGDPTGTGKGGESAWGREEFPDEFSPKLKHDKKGVVSMANKGPNSNSSQFFILFAPSSHLDSLHSVFGMTVGGLNVLNKMEIVDVDSKSKPLKDIQILDTIIYKNPFLELENEEKKGEIKEEKEKRSGIGKYMNMDLALPSKKQKN